MRVAEERCLISMMMEGSTATWCQVFLEALTGSSRSQQQQFNQKQ